MTNESMNRLGTGALLLVFLILAIALVANVGKRTPVMEEQNMSGGDPRLGSQAIQKYGCGTCHQIPGIAGADGRVGPKLVHLSKTSFLAGELPNNPDDLILWIQHPQQIRPGNDMPDLGVSEND